MARQRSKLTDKQERILVQAQLMGLTASDMTKIANRLVALKREADEIKNISESTQGYNWHKDDTGKWTVITPEGYHCRFTKEKTGRTNYWDRSWDYTISITKPGTAFKTRTHRKKSVIFRDEWIARLCPENSKELYGMIKFCGTHIHQLIAKP